MTIGATIILFIIGIALAASTAAYMLLCKVQGCRYSFKPALERVRRSRRQYKPKDWYPVMGAFGGMLASLLVMGGSINWTVFQFMTLSGIAMGYTAKTFISKETHYSTLRDASSFFKAVAARLKVGYKVPYSMQMAVIHTPSLEPAVNKCLQQWSFGPKQAIETLRKELNVPEVETLCHVLLRAHEAGGEKVAHVLEQGARNIDNKLISMEEKSFAVGKMRYLLFRMLPGASIFGIIAGSLGYHFQTMINQSITNIIK